jgi:hypothetical protein
MEVNPLVLIIEDSELLKRSFDIYECLCPCNECTGWYSGLGLRFRCLCYCHHKQFPHRGIWRLDNLAQTDMNVAKNEPWYTRYTNRLISAQRQSEGGTTDEQEKMIQDDIDATSWDAQRAGEPILLR